MCGMARSSPRSDGSMCSCWKTVRHCPLLCWLHYQLWAVNHSHILNPAFICWHSFGGGDIQVHGVCQGILITAHVASTPLKHHQRLFSSPKCPYYSVKCQLSERGGEIMFFSLSLSNNERYLFTDLQPSSMIERLQTSRTRSCISPTTAWTKRAVIMSGKLPHMYTEQVAVGGRPPDSSLHSSSGLWSVFLSFQLRWPWSRGLREQMEYERSAEVFEAGGKRHHMWVRPFFYVRISCPRLPLSVTNS